jgi:NAD(P)-dependent dehydrogenase (short-subunit alcohol dehydrogenase family)
MRSIARTFDGKGMLANAIVPGSVETDHSEKTE